VTDDDERQAAGRLGLLGHGTYYLLLTLLTGRLLLGNGAGQETGPRGAIATVARQPFGQVLLAGLTLAFLAYAGVRWVNAVREDELRDRLMNGLRAIVWTALTLLAGRALVSGLTGGGSGGGTSGTSITRRVLEAPGGTWIVVAVGLFLAGVAAYQFREATDDTVVDELRELGLDERRAARWLGRAGYLGRALAYGLVALFVIQAALTRDPSAGRGLDGALQQAQSSSWGPFLLGAVTIGFAAFGLFRLVEARFARDPM
jgi:hypothetical protein